MTEALFDDPADISAIKWADQKGRLVLIWPREIKDFKFNNGEEGKVTEARVIVLDAPGGPIEYANTIVFPKVLQGRIRSNVGTGRPNLGRIGQGQAKAGQSAPWELEPASESDKQLAVRFLTSNAVAKPAEPASDSQPGWNAGDPPF
jgi:hypothetical protein